MIKEFTPERSREEIRAAYSETIAALQQKMRVHGIATEEEMRALGDSQIAFWLDRLGVFEEMRERGKNSDDAASILFTLQRAAVTADHIASDNLRVLAMHKLSPKEITDLVIMSGPDFVDGFHPHTLDRAIRYLEKCEPSLSLSRVLKKHPAFDGILCCPDPMLASLFFSSEVLGGTAVEIDRAFETTPFAAVRFMNLHLLRQYALRDGGRAQEDPEVLREFLQDERTSELFARLARCVLFARRLGGSRKFAQFGSLLVDEELIGFENNPESWVRVPDFELAARLAFEHMSNDGDAYFDSTHALTSQIGIGNGARHFSRYIKDAEKKGLDVKTGTLAERFTRFNEHVLDEVLTNPDMGRRLKSTPVAERARAQNAIAINNLQRQQLFFRRLNFSMPRNQPDRAIVLYYRPGMDPFHFALAYKTLSLAMERKWFSVFNKIQVVSRNSGDYPKFVHDLGLAPGDYLDVRGRKFRSATSHGANLFHLTHSMSIQEQFKNQSVPVVSADTRNDMEVDTRGAVPLRAMHQTFRGSHGLAQEPMERGDTDPVRYAFEMLKAAQRAERVMLERAGV